jgi:hypothetical protein
LAEANSKEVKLWELATTAVRGRIGGSAPYPEAFRFSPDGRWLAMGAYDHGVHLFDVLNVRKVHSYAGHDHQVRGLDFSPDGRSLASSSLDTTIMIWDVAGVTSRLPKTTSTPEAEYVVALWNGLRNSDPVIAYDAVRLLAQAPDKSLPFLRERLKPARDPDIKQVESFLAKLDSPWFAERDEAKRELERYGNEAEPALERYLAGNLSLEAQQRAEALLARARAPLTDALLLQQVRALEVLETIGTTEARSIMSNLAAGSRDARLTREARAALERLERRGSGK